MIRTRLRRRTRWGIGIRLSDLKPTTKYVALMIQTWADENGERARPGYPTLAKGSGLCRSTIADHVKKLHKTGWLGVQSNRGRNHSNLYTLTIPAVYEALIEQALGTENVRPDGPFEGEDVQDDNGKRPGGLNKTSAQSDPSLPEPSIEPLWNEGDLTADQARAEIERYHQERKAQRKKKASEARVEEAV